MSGWVYALSNPSLHSDEGKPLYKVGFTCRTTDIRMEELYRSTGVPTPFCLVESRWVNIKKEKLIHKVLNQYRINKDREFFNCPIAMILTLFDLMDEKKTVSKSKVTKVYKVSKASKLSNLSIKAPKEKRNEVLRRSKRLK